MAVPVTAVRGLAGNPNEASPVVLGLADQVAVHGRAASDDEVIAGQLEEAVVTAADRRQTDGRVSPPVFVALTTEVAVAVRGRRHGVHHEGAAGPPALD